MTIKMIIVNKMNLTKSIFYKNNIVYYVILITKDIRKLLSKRFVYNTLPPNKWLMKNE